MKKCPRCGLKYFEGAEACEDCGLVFSRLEQATNKDAKRKLLRFDRSYIIRTKKLPKDVKYWKLLLVTILTGYTGAHCFYVGRYARGILLLTNFVCCLLEVVFNSQLIAWSQSWTEFFAGVNGFILLLWIWDVWCVAWKRFKVPVAIDLEDEGVDV